jgi:hypothetical protein
LRIFSTVAVLAFIVAPAASAQSSAEPSMSFTVSGGLTTGQNLWNLDRHLLAAPGATYDTVRLGRRLTPGLAASLAVSLFRSPHWGLNAEVGYFGLSSEQRCTGPLVYQPDSENLTKKGCDNANGRHSASSVIGFMAGGVYQFLDSSRIQPYIRATAGFGLLGASFVETLAIVNHSSCQPIASDNICPYPLLTERRKTSSTWLVSVAGGLVMQLGPGYRIRMEGRDLILQLPVVRETATPTSNLGPSDSRSVIKHVPIFMIGFDVMLERRRSRRY